jgi:hypothetical protein
VFESVLIYPPRLSVSSLAAAWMLDELIRRCHGNYTQRKEEL